MLVFTSLTRAVNLVKIREGWIFRPKKPHKGFCRWKIWRCQIFIQFTLCAREDGSNIGVHLVSFYNPPKLRYNGFYTNMFRCYRFIPNNVFVYIPTVQTASGYSMWQSNVSCSVFWHPVLSYFTANTSFIPLFIWSSGEVRKLGEQHLEYICEYTTRRNSGFPGICSFYSFTTSWYLSLQSMRVYTVTHIINIRVYQISALIHALFMNWGFKAFRVIHEDTFCNIC